MITKFLELSGALAACAGIMMKHESEGYGAARDDGDAARRAIIAGRAFADAWRNKTGGHHGSA